MEAPLYTTDYVSENNFDKTKIKTGQNAVQNIPS